MAWGSPYLQTDLGARSQEQRLTLHLQARPTAGERGCEVPKQYFLCQRQGRGKGSRSSNRGTNTAPRSPHSPAHTQSHAPGPVPRSPSELAPVRTWRPGRGAPCRSQHSLPGPGDNRQRSVCRALGQPGTRGTRSPICGFQRPGEPPEAGEPPDQGKASSAGAWGGLPPKEPAPVRVCSSVDVTMET